MFKEDLEKLEKLRMEDSQLSEFISKKFTNVLESLNQEKYENQLQFGFHRLNTSESIITIELNAPRNISTGLLNDIQTEVRASDIEFQPGTGSEKPQIILKF